MVTEHKNFELGKTTKGSEPAGDLKAPAGGFLELSNNGEKTNKINGLEQIPGGLELSPEVPLPLALQPNLDEAGRFLAMLDPTATKFTFQTFDDVKERKRADLAGVYNGALEDLAPVLANLNRRGAGIFVTVNETDLKGREAANVLRARAVWQDDDAGHGWDVSLPASIVVNTS